MIPIGVASCVGGVCLKIRYIHNYRTSTSKVSKSDQENHILLIPESKIFAFK